MLYQPHVIGAKDPVAFSSPWRSVTFDRVDDVSGLVQLASNSSGDYEISIPLDTLGLSPSPVKASEVTSAS